MISSYGVTGFGYKLVPQVRLIGQLESAAPAAQAAARPPLTNLLSPANGGQILAAPHPSWEKIISGNDNDVLGIESPGEAIFAFKDERSATFATFAMLIKEQAAGNPAEFELLVSDDLSGPFRSLGTFKAQNIRLTRTPYQEFTFPETTAKYLKLRVISSYGRSGFGYMLVPQVRLLGTPN